LLRALHQHELRQWREVSEARFRHRLINAAGIDSDKLPAQGQRTMALLCGFDDSTIDEQVEILTATRTAAQVAVHRETSAGMVRALRDSEAATEAALVRYDEREDLHRAGG
jgi:hypothetical protein